MVDGKIEPDEFDKKQEAEEKLQTLKEEIKVKERQEGLIKGRSGKGNQRGYKRFCKGCFTEYLIEIEKCTHCSKETITEEV